MERTTLYFIRHPESLGNVDRSVHSHISDEMISLSNHGFYQISSCVKFLGEKINVNESLSICYSPFLRSRLLANSIIQKFQIPGSNCYCDERLREISYGDIKGLTDDEWQNNYATNYDKYRQLINPHDRLNFLYPNGESLYNLMLRLTIFKNEILDCISHPQIIIVSHDKALRMLLATLNDEPATNYFNIPTIPNVGIVCVHKAVKSYQIDSFIYPTSS